MSDPKKPWEQAWQHGTQGRSGVVVRVDEPGRTTRVCDPWRAPGMSDEEQLAAADLVAAAPEMYRAIVEYLEASEDHDCMAMGKGGRERAADRGLVAALKKARGHE